MDSYSTGTAYRFPSSSVSYHTLTNAFGCPPGISLGNIHLKNSKQINKIKERLEKIWWAKKKSFQLALNIIYACHYANMIESPNKCVVSDM